MMRSLKRECEARARTRAEVWRRLAYGSISFKIHTDGLNFVVTASVARWYPTMNGHQHLSMSQSSV